MGKRILILSNHFITLYNFRKELIQRLNGEGHEVFISMPKSDENKFFIGMGCKIIDTSVDRRGINPIRDFILILKYIRIMIAVKPDIVFSYTIKPNIYGSIASNITGYKQVNNITGTGGIFINKSIVGELVKILYKISIKNSYKVFFQNKGDKEFFIKNKLIKRNYETIPGSGVNLTEFQVSELPFEENINFIFIGRVMKLKGIDQYIEMAKVIKKEYPNTNFYIAGFIEENEYKTIINDYDSKGIINYIGFQKDIKSWIEKCHCTILPSHGGEGISNALLESAAMGRICIVSNISGSSDVVEDEVTGYLFEPGNSNALINKVKKFIELSNEEKKQMGLIGRAKVEREFDREMVIAKYTCELTIK